MEYDLHWDNEVVADNDEMIAFIEADITEDKAVLRRLSDEEDLLSLGL